MVSLRTLGGYTLEGIESRSGAIRDPEIDRRLPALLALLAAAGDRGVVAERVCELLWPGTADAGVHLDQLIGAVRDTVHAGAFRSLQPLALDPAVVRSDVAAFDHALDVRDTAAAVAEYRGEFMAGFVLGGSSPFDVWLESERARIGRRHRSVLATMALRSTPTGRTAAIAAVGKSELQHVRSDVPVPAVPVADDARARRGAAERGPSHERAMTIAGRYRVTHEIGRGGMATVLRARDLKHGRDVAVKIVHAELADTVSADRFTREIAVVASLQHPHIVALFDSGEIGRSPFYVMPYVEGETLRDRLGRDGTLPLGDALRIAREVADALAYAHARGVVHRDVKPANILLSQGHALVGDFGVARAIDRASGGYRLTDDGFAVGTPAYMSPEQLSGDPLDERSDLYSLGCVVYEMLAGVPPFAGSPELSALAQRFLSDPEPLIHRRADTPPALAASVHRALARAPDDRHPSVAEFARELESHDPARGSRRTPWGFLRRWLAAP